MEGFFATGCAFPRETPRSAVEREVRGSTATHGASKPIAFDGAGADGGGEGSSSWHFFSTLYFD